MVRQVLSLLDNKIYAIKTIPLQAYKVQLIKDEISNDEAEIMKNLDHPNIIHMFGQFSDFDFAYD